MTCTQTISDLAKKAVYLVYTISNHSYFIDLLYFYIDLPFTIANFAHRIMYFHRKVLSNFNNRLEANDSHKTHDLREYPFLVKIIFIYLRVRESLLGGAVMISEVIRERFEVSVPMTV